MVHVETTQTLIADLNAEFTRWREGGHAHACHLVEPLWPLDFSKGTAWDELLEQLRRVDAEYSGFSYDEKDRLVGLIRRVNSTVHAS